MTPQNTKYLIAALVVSLGLNLYAATYVIGNHARARMDWGVMSHRQIETMFEKLPRDRQQTMQADFQKHLEQMRANFKESRARREQLAKLLMAEELDQAAIRKQFQQIRNHTTQSQTQMQTMVLEIFGRMTPEERKVAITRMLSSSKPAP